MKSYKFIRKKFSNGRLECKVPYHEKNDGSKVWEGVGQWWRYTGKRDELITYKRDTENFKTNGARVTFEYKIKFYYDF